MRATCSHCCDKVMTRSFSFTNSLLLHPLSRRVSSARYWQIRSISLNFPPWGRIDILVNTAGGNLPGATLTEEQTVFDMKIGDFNKVTDLNLNGTVYPCLVFGNAMSKQKSGSIINISSMATMSSITRVPGYSVAKSGV